MNRLTLILRGLAFHWRAHLAAGLAAALGTAVLVGALLVGDSVRHSLRTMAVERLGEVQLALIGGDRFFRDDLGARTQIDDEPLILIPGICIKDADNSRASGVQVLGVSGNFGKVGKNWPQTNLRRGEMFINQSLASAIHAKVGDQIRVRMQKPSALSQDAPLGSKEDAATILRATVREIIPDRGLGRFSLRANQIVPLNVYLPLIDVQEKLGQKGRANVLLDVFPPNIFSVDKILPEVWSLDDAQLRLRIEPALGFGELSTSRVFLDDAVSDALLNQKPETSNQKPAALVTYFVNAIRANGRETPYSMVTAGEAPLVPGDLKDDEIILNEWTAEDLRAQSGDKVEIEYYTVGLLRKLETRKAAFTVKDIVPIAGLHADKGLMPDFPGIAEVDSTHDWDSSIPIDMKKIRDKDEQYWKNHRGAPKAFIALKKGVELWRNRFGTHTAIRFPIKGYAEQERLALEEMIRKKIDPAKLGLVFTPVRAQALQASEQAVDFGMLFLGFSFFLIVAALLLMALIFQFNIEARASETGLLLALGFTPRGARALLWAEGALMAALGSLIGVAAGNFYAQALLYALATRWRAAVGTSALEFHAEPRSLWIGGAAGIIAAAAAIFFAVRRQTALSARELLASSGAEQPAPGKPVRWPRIAAPLCFVAALAIVAVSVARGASSAAESFFAAGALLLFAALAAVRMLLAERTTADPVTTLARIGVRGASRRSGRSLATAALLACGAFLIIAVGASQKDAAANAERKESGTGGFALTARATLPVFEDLNTSAGRAKVGVRDEGLVGVTIYPFRVKDGDEASCLNLNRAQQPRILGAPQAFIERGGFTFVATSQPADGSNPWKLLNASGPPVVYGICDFQSLTWALGKKVGDTIAVTDEKGAERRIQIVGAVANSILQGSILISEQSFLDLFPSESGYREFLIDTPPEQAGDVAKFLASSLQDEGLQATPAVRRLAEFNAVENTYLSTFQALGALGMLLGSVGLGIVVLRNILERRGELALLRAIGFSRASIGWLVLSEHAWLLALGLGAGVIAALVAIVPALTAASAPVPWLAIGFSLLAIAACGLLSAIAATWAMLRAPLLPALRNE